MRRTNRRLEQAPEALDVVHAMRHALPPIIAAVLALAVLDGAVRVAVARQ